MSNFDARFINFLTILLVLGLMSGLSACQETPKEKFQPTQSEATIVGGERVDTESLFSSRVIYLALGVEKKTTPFGTTIVQKGVCTASALTRRILITAAHCVKEFTKDQIYAVMTINPWNHSLNLDEWIAVEKIKVHEKYIGKESQMGDDLALVKLSKDIEPERVSKLAEASEIKSTSFDIIAIGYGKTTALNEPGPLDDENHQSQVQSNPTMLHSVIKTVEEFDANSKIFQIDQGDFKGICQGDSGGPGFVYDDAKKEFSVLGVTSFVSIFQDEKDSRDPMNLYSACIGRGNYTNLLLYKDWINKAILELK